MSISHDCYKKKHSPPPFFFLCRLIDHLKSTKDTKIEKKKKVNFCNFCSGISKIERPVLGLTGLIKLSTCCKPAPQDESGSRNYTMRIRVNVSYFSWCLVIRHAWYKKRNHFVNHTIRAFREEKRNEKSDHVDFRYSIKKKRKKIQVELIIRVIAPFSETRYFWWNVS